jgi:hypothetical protein
LRGDGEQRDEEVKWKGQGRRDNTMRKQHNEELDDLYC